MIIYHIHCARTSVSGSTYAGLCRFWETVRDCMGGTINRGGCGVREHSSTGSQWNIYRILLYKVETLPVLFLYRDRNSINQ